MPMEQERFGEGGRLWLVLGERWNSGGCWMIYYARADLLWNSSRRRHSRKAWCLGLMYLVYLMFKEEVVPQKDAFREVREVFIKAERSVSKHRAFVKSPLRGGRRQSTSKGPWEPHLLFLLHSFPCNSSPFNMYLNKFKHCVSLRY